MCSPSYGCRGTPVVTHMCLYCAKKLLHKLPKSTGTRTKNILKKEQKVGMLLQKRTDTRGVGISNMRKSIYLLTTTPTSHTHRFHPHPPPANHAHRFHPLSTIVIHTLNFAQVQSMDDNCGEWAECMGVASGCGEQEAGVASGSGWNLWVWL